MPVSSADQAAQSPPYDYPLSDPYAATIIGTPAALQDGYSLKQPTKHTLVMFPERQIPEGFWYYRGLPYGEMLQDHPAPLTYIIGGTGSSFRSDKSVALANILYRLGYHVVTLPSPTHSSFIVTAGSDFYPGNAQNDASDLYRAIQLIQAQVATETTITSTSLTGYSLGAWHSAFLAHLDDSERKIGFNKVLLINPPLSLTTSMSRLDNMLYQGLPNGIDGLDKFIDTALARLSHTSQGTDALDFSNANFLLDAYQRNKPTDARMATVIGLAFRLSAANMILTSDIMSHANYIYPKNKPYLSTTPMTPYMDAALRTGLMDYFNDIYRTHYLYLHPGRSQQAMADDTSLLSIGDWLRKFPRIGLITNRDDIILGPGQLDQLESLFAGRSFIFPTGGHLGNMEHRAFTYQIRQFFRPAP